ncbi:MAG: transporter substrate-binding domain-containing protein [Actinomycetota bacterium]|nr:transporter substrate-binding domain-containing protein [Actinomycetota bacterium]
MKNLALAMIVVALAAVTLAAWGLAAPAGLEKSMAHSASVATFPKLPANITSRHRFLIGVKCDFPPFGFIDVKGKNDGYDVQIARRFAQLAFGKINRVSLTCVTTPSRIPTLISGRVDMIISTLTWTQARADQIDFSNPYYSATGRLLVPNDSSITSLADLKGKTIATTRGSIYGTWVRNCFKDSSLLEVDSPAAATLAVKNGQANTFMFDDAFLLGVATQDPTLKLTKDKFLNIPWGIGLRKGDTAVGKWVNAAIAFMKKRDEFVGILKNNAPSRLVADFLDNVPRPKSNFQYPVGKDLTAICP